MVKRKGFALILFFVSVTIAFIFQNCSNSKLVSDANSLAPASAVQQNSEPDRVYNGSDIQTAAISEGGSVISSRINLNKAAATDTETADCPQTVNVGWKCWNTTIISEGNSYKVAIKWSRPNIDSKGSVLMATGGSGVGESRLDPPSKLMMDNISDKDQLRFIQLEFLDDPELSPWKGGYWKHAGGYKSTSLVFTAAVELIIEKQIVRGKFLNYLGGSNATMLMARSMSFYNVDKYFDRVVLQMGPFLPSKTGTCDRLSVSSIYINNADQQSIIFQLMGSWLYGDKSKDFCADDGEDRLSILGPRTSFPNTHMHVIMGALEDDYGFGRWIRLSNIEWYNMISAKTKSRIERPEMAHNNSYKDMRRFLKLAPNEIPEEDTDCIDRVGQFCSVGKITQFNCRGCAQETPPTEDKSIKWIKVEENCYHLATEIKCTD